MTPAQINNALDFANEHALKSQRSTVVRVVTAWGTILDAPAADRLHGMLRIIDMNGALVFMDPHCIGIIAGGLAPLPDSAEIDIQEGELTPKVTQ